MLVFEYFILKLVLLKFVRNNFRKKKNIEVDIFFFFNKINSLKMLKKWIIYNDYLILKIKIYLGIVSEFWF